MAGPFQTFADAVELAKAGKSEEAKTQLHSILEIPNLETRIHLSVWSALRELGEQPNADSGNEILGVVIEVPMRGRMTPWLVIKTVQQLPEFLR